MIRVSLLFLAAVASVVSLSAQDQRPQITGISHMTVYSSDRAASEHFYGVVLHAAQGPDPQNPAGTRYYLSPSQFVEVLPLPSDHGLSRMAATAYSTPEAASLRTYLLKHGVQEIGEIQKGNDGSQWFDLKDPEGNTVQFYQAGQMPKLPVGMEPIGDRIIHVGYEVHSRAAEDRLFKDLLGFRPYWYGAMQPDKLDWISQQVPDGHDWLEYMLVGDGSTTPLDSLNLNHLGVLNHLSIGVSNMERAVTSLYANDRLSPRHDGPQMGKDGKWQANLYDPDGTRVELMEFEPVMKPCCSDFTAASPKPTSGN